MREFRVNSIKLINNGGLISLAQLRGDEAMKKLIKKWLVVSAFFGLVGITQAAEKPFIRISTTPKELDFGLYSMIGGHESSAKLTVAVESNFLHGPIVVSLSKLRQDKSNSVIPPENVMVKTPTSGDFVSLLKPVAISKTTGGSHNIVLYFKVKTSFLSCAGKYEGSLVFTVMPPSP